MRNLGVDRRIPRSIFRFRLREFGLGTSCTVYGDSEPSGSIVFEPVSFKWPRNTLQLGAYTKISRLNLMVPDGKFYAFQIDGTAFSESSYQTEYLYVI